MAIAYDTAQRTTGVDTGTTYTYSHTCTGDNRFLLVYTNNNDSAVAVTGVTYNGVSMTEAVSEQIPSNANIGKIWYLANPASGANNVVITLASSMSYVIVAVTASYTGVAQTSPIDVSGTATGTSVSTISKSLTTTVDNCWSVICGQNAAGAAYTSATTGTARVTGNTPWIDTNGAITPAGAQSLGWNWSGSYNAMAVSVAFKPAVASAATPTQMMMGIGT